MKKLIYYGNMMALALIFLVLPTIALLSCIESPLSPVGPSYGTQLAIPVINSLYKAGQAEQGDTWGYNPDGTFSYINTYPIEKQSVDSITVYPKPDSEKTDLGRFLVGGFAPYSPAPYPIGYFGIDTGSVPFFTAGSLLIDSNFIMSTSVFDYIAVDTGSLTITITNNLPIPIDIPIPVVLRNTWNNVSVATFFITDTVASRSTRSFISSSLAGRILYGNMTVDPVQIHTSGSSSPVRFLSTDNITISFRPTSMLRADSATSIIPGQDIVSDSNTTFTVDTSLTLRRATFKSGNLAVEIDNRINLTTKAHLEIKELISTQTGLPLVIDTTFIMPEKRIINIPIRDYHIENDSIVEGTYLHYSIGITFIYSGTKKHVTKNDFIQAKVSPVDTLYAQSVTGNFPTQHLDVNSGTKADFKLPDIDKSNVDSLKFKGLKVKIRLPFTGGETNPPPIHYQGLTLIAKNSKHNQSDSFVLGDGDIDPAAGEPQIDLSPAEIDNFVNSLVRFYPDLPDSFFVRGQLDINPNYDSTNFYTIQDTSGIYPSVKIDVPSVIGIYGGRIQEVQEISDNIPEDIARSVQNGSVSFSFTNGIPIRMISNIRFLGRDSLNHRDTLVRFDSLGPIAAAHINSADSSADNPVVSNIKKYLTNDQVVKISKSDSVFIRLDFETNSNGSNGAIVKIRNTDAVRVQASVRARFIVNKP